MQTRTFISILILVLAVLIIAASCATRKKAISDTDFFEAYSGTWINKDYSGGRDEPIKVIHFRDGSWEEYVLRTFARWPGRWEEYKYVTREHWWDSGKDTMIEMWTDSNGDIFYKASSQCDVHILDKGFKMGKISDSGNTLETLTLYGNKPIEEWDPNVTRYYYTYYRQ